MSNERMKATVGAALAVLGFRTAVGKDRWCFSAADKPAITALLDGKTVYLKAEGTTLTCKVPRPLGSDFIPRLRKRLGSLSKSAASHSRSERRASRKVVKSADIRMAPLEACVSNSRNYDPLAFCETCRHMVRESLMHSAALCEDCAGWSISRRAK